MKHWTGLRPLEQIVASPTAIAALMEARTLRAQMLDWQALALYELVAARKPGHVLEIGTATGFSAYMIASAGCRSLTTINPVGAEVAVARANLEQFQNVSVVMVDSLEFRRRMLLNYGWWKPRYNMVFVDGDHNIARLDARWFGSLYDGGLILFHDYTPADARRSQCPPVYAAVNEMARTLGREPDVLMVDDDLVGMAGFIKRPGERIE